MILADTVIQYDHVLFWDMRFQDHCLKTGNREGAEACGRFWRRVSLALAPAEPVFDHRMVVMAFE